MNRAPNTPAIVPRPGPVEEKTTTGRDGVSGRHPYKNDGRERALSQFRSTVVEISRAVPLRETRVVTEVLMEPGDGELVLAVERFSLSANNLTYATLGNSFGLNYWHPFPTEDGWGRVPAWGVARVLAGDPALARLGERFVGFVPMASHMAFRGTRTNTGLRDTSTEREGMLPIYRDMRGVSTDPTWREGLLRVNLVLRPVYPPAALLDDALYEAEPAAVVLTSATSKTALMIARLLTVRGVRTTGLTSGRHLDDAVSTGAYDHVLTYDAVGRLASEPTVLIDVAGNPALTRAVHTHLASNLTRSIFVGGTHLGAADTDDGALGLPGPKPEQFNTGDREVELAEERGDGEVLHLEDAARDALLPWAASWMGIRTIAGPQAIQGEWLRLTQGSGRGSPLSGAVAVI